jgi:signal transduction histidine kinase
VVIEYGALPRHLSIVVEILETRFEEVIAAYEERLLDIGSPLITEAKAREQVMAQARSVLEEVTSVLHGREIPSDVQQRAADLSDNIGVSRASGNVHAFHSLRAVVAFSEATLAVLADNLPQSSTSGNEITVAAIVIQKVFMERVMRAAFAYANYLLQKAHESCIDERRRISRELHDRVAHSIMVAFRSLELYEGYKAKDPSKAQARFSLAKSSTQEALELTRGLSRELRSTSAEEGLEAALSELLSISVPKDIWSWVSVDGDESLLTPQVRDELYLILREGIRNAVTHAEASMITVEVEIDDNQVKAAVKDNGRGFDPLKEAPQSDSGTGLASMRERASLLGGTVTLISDSDKGARVEIVLPLLPRSRI